MRNLPILAVLTIALLWAPVALAGPDFNGDGRSDVLWRQANGQPMLWLMNGLDAPTYQATGPVMGNAWMLAGSGHFGGSADGGFLWLSAGSAPVIWYLANGRFSTSCSVSNATLPTGARFLGLGDVDGDGNTDVLWQGADGRVSAWAMAICTVTRTIALGTAPASAVAAAVADFDGDGKADLLWRQPSGEYTLWQLSGGGVGSTTTLTPAIAPTWQLAKAADFNRDGKADLLWRLPGGSLALSYMNGAAHTDVAVAPADTDAIFADGFGDTSAITPPVSLSPDWRLVDAGDYDGDGQTDLLFANAQGYTQIWRLNGTSVLAAVMLPPTSDMPYPGITGWVLPPDRPTVTQVDAQVSVTWPALPGIPSYTVHASAQNNPAATGSASTVNGTTLSYARNASGFADKRYFSVSTSIFGQPTPPSPEAWLLEFNIVDLNYIGAMAISDINNDGCIDILGALGNCRGGFSLLAEADIGLGAVRANGRTWRDLRFADFDGDGIDDVIAAVYAPQSDNRSRVLLFRGLGNGQFVEDTAFTALGLGGFDETLVVADFDNDGSLDIFLPKYTFYDATEHNYLLMNDGHGHFIDMADSAGVAMRNTPLTLRPEGAQAVDLDGDGRIDVYTGSHLFMNRTTQPGQPKFVDQAASRGLPQMFDEGTKFLDWNNDGALDLVLLGTGTGPRLWQSNGDSFHFVDVMPTDVTWNQASGMNVVDLDGDGRPDIVADRGCLAGFNGECTFVGAPHKPPALLLNRDSGFVRSDYFDDGISDDYQRPFADLQTFADFDANGAMDVAIRYPYGNPASTGITRILMNRARSDRTIKVTVLGAAGERNQYGRVVRISPSARPGFVMTDVVDGGSGYLANGPYRLQFAAPWSGNYRVEVRFADRLVEVFATAGQALTFYADGRAEGAATPATVTLLARPD